MCLYHSMSLFLLKEKTKHINNGYVWFFGKLLGVFFSLSGDSGFLQPKFVRHVLAAFCVLTLLASSLSFGLQDFEALGKY